MEGTWKSKTPSMLRKKFGDKITITNVAGCDFRRSGNMI